MRKYTPEIIDFMEQNVKKASSYFELTELVNKKFGVSFTSKQIRSVKSRFGLRSGDKRGHPPPLPIGTEITDQKGLIIVKVSDVGQGYHRKGEWIGKHRLIWEQAHGSIPEGYRVIFLDGNKSNFALDNLALATRAEICSLNKYGLQFSDKEMTRAGLAIIRHKAAIAGKIKEKYGYAHYAKYSDNTKTEEGKRKYTKNEYKFTPSIIAFIKNQCEKPTTYFGIMESVNRHFGTLFTYKQIKNFMYRNGLYCRKRAKPKDTKTNEVTNHE